MLLISLVFLAHMGHWVPWGHLNGCMEVKGGHKGQRGCRVNKKSATAYRQCQALLYFHQFDQYKSRQRMFQFLFFFILINTLQSTKYTVIYFGTLGLFFFSFIFLCVFCCLFCVVVFPYST